MSWFEDLTGFSEKSPQHVRENITIQGESMISSPNGKSMIFGRLETPTLDQLRIRAEESSTLKGRLSIREVIGDVQGLHMDLANEGSLFQVASQFNLLEMVSPSVTPEDGVGIYENDRTQGPACAIAAGAGTIYRNYFMDVNGRVGQSAEAQIDCLFDIGQALGNQRERLWVMQNGYALASEAGLMEISNRLRAMGEGERDSLRSLLRIGIQWNTQVTLHNCSHKVTQAYCSALPVAYSAHAVGLWEDFARLILEASYEAVLCAVLINYHRTGSNKVYLTLLGGGAFGNRPEWILEAIQRALVLFIESNLDIAIVSHRYSNPSVQKLVSSW